MTSEAELNAYIDDHEEWIPEAYAVESRKLQALFKGKKLVDASAVVLSAEDAEQVQSFFRRYCPYSSSILNAAIEQARGNNGSSNN